MDAKDQRWRRAALWLALAVLSSVGAVQAQGVYKSQGAQGPVFSDKPQPGAREVSLPPLNVIESPGERASPTPPRAAEGRATSEPEAPAYRSFAVVFPENDGSVVANTKSAEQAKPIAVPENSQWKFITVSRAAASIGLVRLSMS